MRQQPPQQDHEDGDGPRVQAHPDHVDPGRRGQGRGPGDEHPRGAAAEREHGPHRADQAGVEREEREVVEDDARLVVDGAAVAVRGDPQVPERVPGPAEQGAGTLSGQRGGDRHRDDTGEPDHGEQAQCGEQGGGGPEPGRAGTWFGAGLRDGDGGGGRVELLLGHISAPCGHLAGRASREGPHGCGWGTVGAAA